MTDSNIRHACRREWTQVGRSRTRARLALADVSRLVRAPHPPLGRLDARRDLLAAKGDRVVSLVVPARNEAATVGDVVTRVREALVDTVALLDEIVVIDSDSTDDTYDVATDAGAVVHRSAEIRPDLGTLPGQGRGDVEVAVRDHGRGHRLHGRRPARLGHPLRARAARAAADPARGRSWSRASTSGRWCRATTAVPFEGGRVTELVARPLIRLLFPELGRAAPAAGRGVGDPALAVRDAAASRPGTPSSWPRSSTPLRAHGLDAIAQVDLGTRAHRHQCAARPQRHGDPDPGRRARPGRRTGAGERRAERPPGGGGPMTLRAGPARVRRRRHADDGDRQPHPRLVLRQGRDLGRGQGLRAGRAGRRARAPRSSTSAASRPRPASRSARPRRRRGSSTSWPGCARRIPALVISVDTWRASVGARRLRGRRRRAQRRLGRRRPRAGRRRGRSTAPRSSAPTPAASRRGPGPTGSSTTTWSPPRSPTPSPTPSGRSPPASPASRSSSTRPTTSARTPSTPSSSPAGSARWSTPAGRCWSRCPTRTSSARPSTCRSASGSTGTLAATAVCALAGARIYRVHEVVETRQIVDMVRTIAGRRPPARAIRGLQ